MTDQGEEEFERVKGNELLNIEKVHGDFPREGFLVPPTPPLKTERIDLRPLGSLGHVCLAPAGGPMDSGACLPRLWACWVWALWAQTQQAQTWRPSSDRGFAHT